LLARSCVVSATSAVIYCQTMWESLPLIPGTIVVLAFFAALSLWGITDSANVALGMFTLHLATMTVLVFACLAYVIKDGGSILKHNFHGDFPAITMGRETLYAGTAFHSLFFGAC
jgi:amino acid transporter